MLDLINYEFLKNKLWRNHNDLFTIHEHLGKIDASIAIASFIKSQPYLCQPEIDFTDSGPVFFDAAGIVHPKLKPVSYTHLRTHETVLDLVCRLLLEKTKNIER
mgnify:CR=1 FL=1